jgi:hypothetical protein
MDPEVQTGTDVGESTPVAPETTSAPEVDRSKLSDEELLGIGSYEKEEPVEATPVAETKPVVEQPEAPQPVAASEDEVLAALPNEELKQLLGTNPKLRDFYFAERSYREMFPTIAEARELRSMFPTVDDARGIATQAERLLAAERVYVDQPQEFIKGIAQGNPAAFEKFADALPGALYDIDPNMYRAKVAEPVVRSLIANMSKGAVQAGDEELQAAVAVLSERLGLQDQAPAATPAHDPRLAEWEALKRDAEERQQETARNFDASIQRTFFEGLNKTVDEAIKQLNPSMSERALVRVHNEIVEGVVAKLTQNQWLSGQAQALQRGGGYDMAHLERVVGLLAKHASPLIAPTVKTVMNEWTNDIVRANAQERSEAKRVAGQKEIGANAAPRDDNGRFKKVVPNHELYQKYTDMDIIEGKHREA